jgi:hypothetical protein
MALISFNNPNIDRIIDRDYEAYTDRLWEEAYGDHGERCHNCWHFESGYADGKCYCGRVEATDEEIENDDYSAYEVDPEDCCEHWEPREDDDGPDEDR